MFPPRLLVWLPWFAGAPPFSERARLQLACAFIRLQHRGLQVLPHPKARPGLPQDVLTSGVRDPPVDREITYRVDHDVIIVLEVLPAESEVRGETFAIIRRLNDYQARRGDLSGSAWQCGGVGDFLGLTRQQADLAAVRVRLGERLMRLRWQHGWIQTEMAARLHASRATVSRMESADISVSLDAMIRTLLELGLSPRQLGFAIAGPLQPEPARLADPRGRGLGPGQARGSG
jgi:hypothetical protein